MDARQLALVGGLLPVLVLTGCASSASSATTSPGAPGSGPGSGSTGSAGSSGGTVGTPGSGEVGSGPLPSGAPFAANVVHPTAALDLRPMRFSSVDSAPASADLTLRFALSPGPPYQVLGRVDVQERPTEVVVTLQVGRAPGTPTDGVHLDLALPAVTTVTLSAPLGERRVVDGAA